MEFLKITLETEPEFEGIARKLFHNYIIKTGDTEYRLTEIEFYWHSPTHPDPTTYKRIHAYPEAGEWFFHYSGVDIALKNDELQGYGGILIRGLYDIHRKKSVKGPQVCAMKLFSGHNAFHSDIQTRIIEHSFSPALPIIKRHRFGIGENGKKAGTDTLRYSFSINP
jgi:hypothetical protein